MHPDQGGHSLDKVKSHLAIALGIAATEAGYRTFFTTAADMDRILPTIQQKFPETEGYKIIVTRWVCTGYNVTEGWVKEDMA